MADSPLSPVALRARRERTIELLCEHFARDHLEATELEQLIDRAHQATSLAQLDELVADLPALSTAAPAARDEPAPLYTARGNRDQQWVAAVMGGAERRGAWFPARQTNVLAFMGGVCLDFREARLDPGVTEINVLAIMGGVEIVVPEGVHVESTGIGIMGGFEHTGKGRFPIDSSVPVLRISGLAFMGGVEIREQPRGRVGSGEHFRQQAADDWRTRKRQLKKARRELRDELRRLGRGE